MPVFAYEVMYYFKNKSELIVISILFLTYFFVAPFALKAHLHVENELYAALLWLALLSIYSMAGLRLYERDRLAGRLELYQSMGLPLERVVGEKWLASFLVYLMPLLAIAPAASLFGGINEGAGLMRLWLSLLVGGAALSAVSNACAALTAGLGQGVGAMIGLLVLPLSIPVIIFGADYTQTGRTNSLLFVLGVALFMVPAMCLAGASAIRRAH